MWVCCRCDIIVIYDIIDRLIEMICSVSANNIESCIADNTKIKFRISKLMVITEGLVITVRRVTLFYEARVGSSFGQS